MAAEWIVTSMSPGSSGCAAREVAVDDLDPFVQESQERIVGSEPRAERIERRLPRQVVDPLDRGGARLGPDEQHDPRLREVGEEAFEDHLTEETGHAREEDALAGQPIHDRNRLPALAAFGLFLYHPGDYRPLPVGRQPSIQGTVLRGRRQDVGLLTGEPAVSLRSKMLAMSTIPVVVLMFAVVYAVSAQLAASRTNTEVDRTNTVRQALAEVQNDLGVAESSVRGFLLTERAGMRTDYEEAVADLRHDLAAIHFPLADELQRKRLERLNELVDERVETFMATLRAGTTGTPDARSARDSAPPRADDHRRAARADRADAADGR